MNVHLLHPAADYDPAAEPPANHADLSQDLGLPVLWRAMAGDDPFLYEIARHVTLTGLDQPELIRYRQAVLADCLAQPDRCRQLHGLITAALERRRGFAYFGFRSPEGILYSATQTIGLFLDTLRDLRRIADGWVASAESDGLRTFLQMLQAELGDDYLDTVAAHLGKLRFRQGVSISTQLEDGLQGRHHVLRDSLVQTTWLRRLIGQGPESYTYRVPDRDESGERALAALRGQGINLVANAAGQSADHIVEFLEALRREAGFYVACLNLADRLRALDEPIGFPQIQPGDAPQLVARGLYDVCLSLRTGERSVANDLDADGRRLVVITGANQGGKSTFLRSVGVAAVMAQAGMFVGAGSLSISASAGVFTHFKREEDSTMQSGKLDEELGRMSTLVDRLRSSSLVLLNESFAATNEREGSLIAGEIIRALTERRIRVLFVTHLYDLADELHRQRSETVLFLRAERTKDGGRTFHIVPAAPLETSYGADLYDRVFPAADGPPAAAAAGSQRRR